MPIIERPHRDALRMGIDIYIDTMREFIVGAIDKSNHVTLPVENQIYHDLENLYRDRYWQQLSKNDRCVTSAIDIADFKRLLAKNWFLIFDNLIDGNQATVINLLDRITDGRNQAFHFAKSDLDWLFVSNRLGDITGMMRRIGAKEEERAVVDINRRLMSGPAAPLHLCDLSLDRYVGLLASRRRTRHAHAHGSTESSVDAQLDGHICTKPYNALTFSRIRPIDPTYHPCDVPLG